MKSVHKRDLSWGVFFLIFSIFVWIIVPYQIGESRYFAIGPRFFPRVVSLILGVMSLGLVISTYLKHRKSEMLLKQVEGEQDVVIGKPLVLKDELRALLVFALMILYAIAMPHIGFILASMVVSGLILVVLGAKKWYYFVIMALAVFAIFYVFRYFLYVQLPSFLGR